MTAEIVHPVQKLQLAPGETLEAYGYSPEDILDTKDASYSSPDGRQHQDLLTVWVLGEREVEVSDE